MAERNYNGYNISKTGGDQIETSVPLAVRDLEPPLLNCPTLPYPDDALVAMKNKTDPQVRIRSSDKEDWGRSYESLRKGLYVDEMAETGLPWDCQRVGANEPTVEEVDRERKGRGRAMKRKKSRTLVKFRQPGDRKPREF